MFNKIILMGNLGRDPEIQMTQDGKRIARFPLATSISWRNEESKWQKQTDWHQVIVYREKTVSWIKEALRKGSLVCVEGALNYKYHKDRQGNFHWDTYIVVSEQNGRVERFSFQTAKIEEKAGISETEDDPAAQDPENLDPEEDSIEYSHELFQNTPQNNGKTKNEELNEQHPE